MYTVLCTCICLQGCGMKRVVTNIADSAFPLWHMQVRPPRRALTIYEKMQIVKYAEELEAASPGLASRVPTKRVKEKVCNAGVEWKKKKRRGVDIQSLCKTKFGPLLGGIRVTKLRQRARVQKWYLLTEAQQRKMYSLTDEVKKALKLEQRIKGWRALSEEDTRGQIESSGKVQRWKVPGEIIKELERISPQLVCRNHPCPMSCAL